MRRQARAQAPKPVAERGLEVAGDGNDPWRRPGCDQAFDQGELGFRPKRRLNEDDFVALPEMRRQVGG